MKYIRKINELFGYSEDVDDKIKKFLIIQNDFDDWEEFIASQSIGESKSITNSIVEKFPEVKIIFGEIEVDYNYYDESGDEQNLMPHYWVEINGVYYDFAKGTLKYHINWDDIYNYCISKEEWRYNKL
jgi:predicted TIM-barrel fold metal-dependent hydrolase